MRLHNTLNIIVRFDVDLKIKEKLKAVGWKIIWMKISVFGLLQYHCQLASKHL